MNVIKDNNNNNKSSKIINMSTDKPNYGGIGNTGNISSNPHQKSLRFSDLFFPDPMFFPGYYPMANSYSPLFPEYDPAEVDAYYKRKAKYEVFKHHIEKSKGKGGIENSLRKPIRDQLDRIKNTLGVSNTYNTSNESSDYARKDLIYVEREPRGNNNISSQVGGVETGFEDKIKHLKDKLLNNKKNKNLAIYQNLLGK